VKNEVVCERCGKRVPSENAGMISGRHVCVECYNEIKGSIPDVIYSVLSRLAEMQLEMSKSYLLLQSMQIMLPGSSINEVTRRAFEEEVGRVAKGLEEVYMDLWNYFVGRAWETRD
jgi:hypothetical protein